MLFRGLQLIAMLAAILAFLSLAGFAPRALVMERSPECTAWQALSDLRAREAASKQFAGVRVVGRDGDLSLWETPAGKFWAPGVDAAEAIALIAVEEATDLYGHPPCSRGDVVLDCGAHIGMYTRSALAHGAGLVLAVEPSPRNIAALRRNFEAEIATGTVVIIEKGVWNTVGSLSFAMADDSSGDRIETEGGPSISIPVTTIDQIVRDYSLTRLNVIKMDIEGAERQALAGSWETLSRFHPRLRLAAYHRPGDPQAFLALAPGYRMQCAFCLPQGNRITAAVAYLD